MATFKTVTCFSCRAKAALPLNLAASSCGMCIQTHCSQSSASTSATQTCSSDAAAGRIIRSHVAPISRSAHHHASCMLSCCRLEPLLPPLATGMSSVTWCRSSPWASDHAIVTNGLPCSALPTVYVQCSTHWSSHTASLEGGLARSVAAASRTRRSAGSRVAGRNRPAAATGEALQLCLGVTDALA